MNGGEVSYLLELLGRGLDGDIGDMLDRYYWSPQAQGLEELRAEGDAHPDWPDVQFRLGAAYLRGAQVEEAIRHLGAACRRKPDYLAARVALAAACDENGDPGGAMEHLKIANQTHCGQAPILLAIGFCCERMRRPKLAAEYYRDAIKRDPSMLRARERLAAVAVLFDDLDEAITQYRAICESQPEQAWTRGALGQLYFRARQYDQSVAEFETAIAMEPENWALIDDEVEALVAQGQFREAIDHLHALIEEQGPFADLRVRLADLYSRCGDDDAATRYYHEALDLQPDYLEATVKLGTHHLIHGRWDQASECFHGGTELNDRLLINYVGMGVAQTACGRPDEAMNSFDLAAAVEPNSTLLLTEMARLQLKAAVAGEFDRGFDVAAGTPGLEVELDNDDLLALQIDRHAEQVQRSPEHADLRYRYGVLLRSEGRLGEAIEQFEQAVRINPAYVQAIIKLGVTQQELGLMEEAIETFNTALDLAPKFVDLHYRLGILHTDRRQFEEALRHMESAAEGAPDNQKVRASLALSLQNMGLMDRAAATWRSLWKIHNAHAD